MRIVNLAAAAAILLLSTAAWAAHSTTTGAAEPYSALLMGAGLVGLVVAGNPRQRETQERA